MQELFNLFRDVAEASTPFNIWPYLLLILPPLVVFSMRPEAPAWLRVGRLIAMILVGYVLINLTLQTGRAQGWKAHEACYEEGGYRHESIKGYEACKHHVNIADGASNIFYGLLGWWPVAAYIAIWDYLWRRKYKLKLKKTNQSFRGRRFSKLLFIIAVPFYIWLVLIFIGFGLHFLCASILPNGTC